MDFGNLKLGITKKKPEHNPLMSSSPEDESMLRELELSKIMCDPNQPRKEIDPTELDELAQNIEQHGLLQPIVVRPHPEQAGYFIIIAGERRYKACQVLSKPTIQALVRNDVTETSLGYLQMAENLKRENLKFYEIAEFIGSKVQAGEKKGTIAKKLGMRSDLISQYMAWHEAPQWLKELKDRIPSVRIFYDFAKEAEQHGDDLQSFIGTLPEGEPLNNVALKAFRDSLEQITLSPLASEDKPQLSADSPTLFQEPEPEATTPEANAADHGGEAPAADDDTLSEDGEILPYCNITETKTGESELVEPADDSYEPDFGRADDQAAEAEPEAANFDFLEPESNLSDDAAPEADDAPEVEPDHEVDHEADSTADDPAEDSALDFEAGADNESADDAALAQDEDEHQLLKHPLILGHVESREAELLYQHQPNADGFVWVRYEDGTTESVLAERFVLNRIVAA